MAANHAWGTLHKSAVTLTCLTSGSQEWTKAVTKDYRAAVARASSRSRRQPKTISQRSAPGTSRSVSAAVVAAKEKKALDSYERILEITTQKTIECETKAAKVETKAREREASYQNMKRKMMTY